MRTILLSFKPFWFEQIMSGNKIFEYRWQFPQEEVMAYTYVSRPIQQITGYMHFSNKTSLTDLVDKYGQYPDALTGLQKQMEHNRFVMNVSGYQETKSINLVDIKEKFPHFVIPQSYYYLDNFTELFDYIKNEAQLQGNMKHNEMNDFPIQTVGFGLLKPVMIG